MIEAIQEALAIERGEKESARVHIESVCAALMQLREGLCPD
jgi:hypothetical protein